MADIAARAKALADLDVELRSVLPAATAANCRLLNVRDGSLVMMARSPVFAARVRLGQRELLGKATEMGLQVSAVVTRVGGWDLPAEEPRVRKPLSPEAAAELLKTADELGADDPLAEVLKRLAETTSGARRNTQSRE